MRLGCGSVAEHEQERNRCMPRIIHKSLLFALPILLPVAFAAFSGCGGGSNSGGPTLSAQPDSTDSPVGVAANATPTPTLAPIPPLTDPLPLKDGYQIGFLHWPNGDTTTGGQGQTIDTVACGIMDESYHVHSHLSIFWNGKQVAIPMALGMKKPKYADATTDPTHKWPDGFALSGQCNYALHTHDTSGKIHIEAPVKTDFYLGQLFKIWGQPLSYSNIAGIKGYGDATVYINEGTHTWRYKGDLAQIKLLSRREITIVIGKPIAKIPTYAWTGY